MRRAMRCGGLAVGIWLAAASGAVAAQICAVTGLEGGSARIERGGTWVALSPGPLAGTDARIETGPETRLQVTCEDTTVITVGPDSRVDLADLLAAAAEKPSIVVQLLEGIAGFVSPEPARADFQVQTPVAVAAVRSTEWFVEHEPAQAHSSVFVRRGRVAVSNGAETFTLEPGEGITVGAGTVVTPVARWGQPRIDRATGSLGFAWD